MQVLWVLYIRFPYLWRESGMHDEFVGGIADRRMTKKACMFTVILAESRYEPSYESVTHAY